MVALADGKRAMGRSIAQVTAPPPRAARMRTTAPRSGAALEHRVRGLLNVIALGRRCLDLVGAGGCNWLLEIERARQELEVLRAWDPAAVDALAAASGVCVGQAVELA